LHWKRISSGGKEVIVAAEIEKKSGNRYRYKLFFLEACGWNFNASLFIPVRGYSPNSPEHFRANKQQEQPDWLTRVTAQRGHVDPVLD
jgi:hypothetical protein